MKKYRSEKSGQAILETYDRILASWQCETKERDEETEYGTTHVIECGAEEAPALVLFHGVGDDSALMWIYNAPELGKHFHLYAIDTMGGPGKSVPNGNYNKEFDDVRWIDGVLDVLDAVPLRPFELKLEGVGAFGDLWWIGLEKSEALNGYVRALRHALAEAGIPFDGKRFSPHITLLRRAEYARPGLPAVAPPRAKMTVRRISLMRSDRGKGGMIYTTVGELSGAPDNSREQGTENREQE